MQLATKKRKIYLEVFKNVIYERFRTFEHHQV